MKNRKTRMLSMALALVLLLGLAAPALASGQTFSDVPESYWGYADIEAVAAAGYMNGTGGGAFSPEMKVSVAQFLTLLGRLVFPDVKAEGSNWFGPYVAAAQEAGLLTGSQVDTGNVEAEISRYDMAVILRAAAKKLGVTEKSAQSSEVTDYLDIPTRYADAVLAVYGMGLIKGDQAGNFNGSNTMMRAEVATVIMRLAKAKPGGDSQGSGADPQPTTDPNAPCTPDEPKSETVMAYMSGQLSWYNPSTWAESTKRAQVAQETAYELRYTEDDGRSYQVVTTAVTGCLDANDPDTFLGYLNSTPFTVDRSLLENPHGQFYISAETNYKDRTSNGAAQHLVTWDRRNVRSCIYPVQFSYNEDGDYYFVEQVDVPMVPSTSNTVTVVFEGRCEAYVRADGAEHAHEASPSDITVKLAYCPDGHSGWIGGKNGGRYVKILGEAVSGSEGTFHAEIEIDELDYYPDKALYTVYAEGDKEGEHCTLDPDYIVSLEDILRAYEQAPVRIRNYTP